MGLLMITLRHFDIYRCTVSGSCKLTGLSSNVTAVARKKAVLHMRFQEFLIIKHKLESCICILFRMVVCRLVNLMNECFLFICLNHINAPV